MPARKSTAPIPEESDFEKEINGKGKKYEKKSQDQSKFLSSSSLSSSTSSSSSSSSSSSLIISGTNAPLHRTPEEHHIFLGTISKKEPPPIRITLSNFNPIKMPIFLESSDTPVCLCLGMSYPIGRKDHLITKANIVDMLFYKTIIPPMDTDDSCSCHSGKMQNLKSNSKLNSNSKSNSKSKNGKDSIEDVDEKIEKLCHYFPQKITKSEKSLNVDDDDDDNDYRKGDDGDDNDDSDDDDYYSDDDDNDDDDDDDEINVEGEDDFYKSLNSYSYDDMNQIKLLELEKERKGRHQEESCQDGGNGFCSSNDAKRADLKKLRIRLKKLILLRKKLIRRKKKAEEERRSVKENENTSLIKVQNRIGESNGDEDKDNDQPISNLQIVNQNIKPLSQETIPKIEILTKRNSDFDSQKSSKSSQKKWTENLSKISGRTGRPLRSLGLVYECGQRAIGVARAGYNSFFHINLNLLDVPLKKSPSQSPSSSSSTSSSTSSSSSASMISMSTEKSKLQSQSQSRERNEEGEKLTESDAQSAYTTTQVQISKIILSSPILFINFSLIFMFYIY